MISKHLSIRVGRIFEVHASIDLGGCELDYDEYYKNLKLIAAMYAVFA